VIRCGLDASDSGQGPVASVVNMMVSLRVPQKWGNFLLPSQEGLCPVS